MRESTHEAVERTGGDSRCAGQRFCRLWTGGQDIGDSALSHNAQGYGNARTNEQFGKALICLGATIGLTECVGAIPYDAMRTDVYCTEPLAAH
jgi:hypothetical protein